MEQPPEEELEDELEDELEEEATPKFASNEQDPFTVTVVFAEVGCVMLQDGFVVVQLEKT